MSISREFFEERLIKLAWAEWVLDNLPAEMRTTAWPTILELHQVIGNLREHYCTLLVKQKNESKPL